MRGTCKLWKVLSMFMNLKGFCRTGTAFLFLFLSQVLLENYDLQKTSLNLDSFSLVIYLLGYEHKGVFMNSLYISVQPLITTRLYNNVWGHEGCSTRSVYVLWFIASFTSRWCSRVIQHSSYLREDHSLI